MNCGRCYQLKASIQVAKHGGAQCFFVVAKRGAEWRSVRDVRRDEVLHDVSLLLGSGVLAQSEIGERAEEGRVWLLAGSVGRRLAESIGKQLEWIRYAQIVGGVVLFVLEGIQRASSG